MFGPIITTEAHPAFSGAKVHSNNTAEMSAMTEALHFLGPRGLVARDVEACIYHDSKHAAFVCPSVNPSPYSCAIGTCMPPVNAMCSTQTPTYHATRIRALWEFR